LAGLVFVAKAILGFELIGRWELAFAKRGNFLEPDLVDALNERMRWRLIQQQRAAEPVA